MKVTAAGICQKRGFASIADCVSSSHSPSRRPLSSSTLMQMVSEVDNDNVFIKKPLQLEDEMERKGIFEEKLKEMKERVAIFEKEIEEMKEKEVMMEKAEEVVEVEELMERIEKMEEKTKEMKERLSKMFDVVAERLFLRP
ncbi:hypothetical protein E1B28_011783 [Marasmius oreades]|uniref:Uncharacterized protein n=1 Tax=Marasmius oreades TaxID=181124 RepID=A0A9P7RUT4_9AGAR|nr:uncharacterized protein E1B28_011783 [Marasmius oreades]KAG7090176.1 hypothetical protein E1B28_011783 [Marasmius oreades]